MDKKWRLPKGWPYIAMAAGCVMLSFIALFVRPAAKIPAFVLCAADVVMFWLIFGTLLLACSYFMAKNTASLEELMKDRTTIVIAHSLSAIKNADYVIVLKDGCVESCGTPESILEMTDNYLSKIMNRKHN